MKVPGVVVLKKLPVSEAPIEKRQRVSGLGTAYVALVEVIRVRFHIIRNARIENVGIYQSCMVSKLRFIWKQTVFVWCASYTLASAAFRNAAGLAYAPALVWRDG